ncbi:CDC6 Cdc6-related protein AAA superfamily ATPase [Pyrenophora tritici-repentis]|nr:CDC6 Cdc6-related protein AAA superfamily ATPase [Pyrenophora tritici-repentis]
MRLERLTAELRNKVTELLKPYDTGHPITYNHYLTENVQKLQSKRQAQEIKRSLEQILGRDYTAVGVVNIPINVNTLINTLLSKTEVDMSNYASSTATDFMEAYYKGSTVDIPSVAMKKIIDDFSVLAVEARLIQELPSLFCPADVIDIDDTAVAVLASESEETSTERTLCNEKLKILEDGLRALQSIQDLPSAIQGTRFWHLKTDGTSMKDLEWIENISGSLRKHQPNECVASLPIRPFIPEDATPAEDNWTYPEQAPTPNKKGDLLSSSLSKYLKKKKTKGVSISFVGRELYLAELEAKLFSNEQTTTTLAIFGPGGTGKSQLALEVAHRIRQNNKHCSVFWIDASDKDNLYQSYASVARKLGVSRWDDE